MSSAIRTCAETEQLLSKTAFDTADFIEFMNNLFDCLNSRSLFSHNQYNAALNHSGTVKTFLLEASKYILNLTKIKKGKISQPPCFKGFTQTINAILQFFEEEKTKTYNVETYITRMSLIHDGNISDFNECCDDEISFNINEFEDDAINWDELDVLQRELETPENSNDQDLSMLTNENSIDDENNQVPHLNLSIQNKFKSDFAWGSNLKFSNKSKFIRESSNDFNQYQRTQWTPLDYFKHFIPDQIMENFSFHTNSRYVEQRGKSLKTTLNEIKKFFGISIFLSSMGYPQIRMYWTKGTRVPLVSNNMARDRYFLIRSNFKILNDSSISDEIKKKDFLWKIRPLLDSVRNGCLQLIRDTHLSIDEQIIPFTGTTRLKQFVKGKPNPEGLKHFVLADRNGLVLDFFIYQGKITTIYHDDCEFSLTLAESIIWHLSETVPPKRVYILIDISPLKN
ncbi:hypothetical protein QTP88_020890 [Uroleucon formosanum]